MFHVIQELSGRALRPRQVGSASHMVLAHVAFDYFHGLRSCDMPISWLNHKPHAIAVYASWPALPSAHAPLATGRPATALPGPVLHRLDCTSFCWRLRKSRLVATFEGPHKASKASGQGVSYQSENHLYRHAFTEQPNNYSQ